MRGAHEGCRAVHPPQTLPWSVPEMVPSGRSRVVLAPVGQQGPIDVMPCADWGTSPRYKLTLAPLAWSQLGPRLAGP
jgi:hypothetical protein